MVIGDSLAKQEMVTNGTTGWCDARVQDVLVQLENVLMGEWGQPNVVHISTNYIDG